MDRNNPESHRHIQKETTLALSTINKIIHQNLSKDTSKKLNVHYLTGRHKKAVRPIVASYMRSTWQEINPNLRSLWMKRSFMSIKQMDRLEFAMYHAEKPYQMIGYLKKMKVSVRPIVGIISGRGTVLILQVPTRVKIIAEYYVN